MKAATLILATSVVIAASGVSVTAEESPNPLIRAHAEAGATPEGALELWFEAVFLYLDPATRDLGREALAYLTLPFKDDPEWEQRPSNATFVGRLRDPAHAHIFRSYARGTSPAGGYAMDPRAWELAVASAGDDPHGRGHRVSLHSSGADTPRPVYLKRSTTTGRWYVSEFANVYVGVRPPLAAGAETFE